VVTLFRTLYVVAVVMLALYGLQAIILSILSVWHRRNAVVLPAIEQWPVVTIQLPTYNELYVAERLLHAVSRINYPRRRLEIQVLDDSTDETSELIAREVARLRCAGFSISLVRRADRAGYRSSTPTSCRRPISWNAPCPIW